jgi:hypothetical protein
MADGLAPSPGQNTSAFMGRGLRDLFRGTDADRLAILLFIGAPHRRVT